MQSKQTNYFEKKISLSDKVQVFSYQVAEIIASQLTPPTIAESLILPECHMIARTMRGDIAEKETAKILLSNVANPNKDRRNSFRRSGDASDELILPHFAMQVDDSTDTSCKTQLLACYSLHP